MKKAKGWTRILRKWRVTWASMADSELTQSPDKPRTKVTMIWMAISIDEPQAATQVMQRRQARTKIAPTVWTKDILCHQVCWLLEPRNPALVTLGRMTTPWTRSLYGLPRPTMSLKDTCPHQYPEGSLGWSQLLHQSSGSPATLTLVL